MKHKLYAFWEHDIPPYVLGGEVTEIKSAADPSVRRRPRKTERN